jgi:hypothetical protein
MSILNEAKEPGFAHKNKWMKRIYLLYPLGVVLAVSLAFAWMVEIGKIGFAARGLFTGVPAIISCIFVLFIYKKDVKLNDIIIFPSLSSKSLTYLFGIFYICSISVILLSHANRPWYYFVFITLLYVFVLLQILSENSNPSLILVELFLIVLNLIYSVTFNYELYFGTTDIMPHILLSEMTYTSGHIVPTSLTDYAYFPLYHIMVAEASHLLNLGIKPSLFLITAPIYAVTIFFVYYLFNYITQNRQISLFSSLLYSSSSVVLYYGVNVITRTMAFVMFVVLLYLIYSVNFIENKLSTKIILIPVAIFLVLVHNVSLPQFVLLMIILIFCEYIVGGGNYISKPFFVLLNVIFTSYWFFVAYLFVQRSISLRIQSQFWDSIVLTSEGFGGVQEYLTNVVGLLDGSIFLFFALIGIGFLLKKYKKNYASVFGLFALITLIFYVPNPINTIWQLHVLFRVDRLMLFVSPFMAFVMGYGIYVFWNYLSKNPSKKVYPSFVILLLFSTFVFVSAVFSISDSEALAVGSPHQYFDSQELRGFEHVKNHIPADSYIYSDYYASRYFYFPITPGAMNEKNLSFFRSYGINDVNNFSQSRGYILIRTKELLRTGLYFSEGERGVESSTYFYKGTPENVVRLDNSLNNVDKIYSSPAEDVFISSSRVNRARSLVSRALSGV